MNTESHEQSAPETAIIQQPLDRPIVVTEGVSLLPSSQQEGLLAEYDTRRQTFKEWLLSHMAEGVHYGTPPGCESRKRVDAKQWKKRPMLYKAGALLLKDLLRLRCEYEHDQDSWAMGGSQPGNYFYRCRVFVGDREIGSGLGQARKGEKDWNDHTAIQQARKRALSSAIFDAIPVVADLFVEDVVTVSPPPPARAPSPQAKANDDASRRMKALYGRWLPRWRALAALDREMTLEEFDQELKIHTKLPLKEYGRWCQSVTGKPPAMLKTGLTNEDVNILESHFKAHGAEFKGATNG